MKILTVRMFRVFTFFIMASFIISCAGTKSQKKKLTYKNIVILSDLSSRMDNKPNKDIQKIEGLIDYFKNDCVKPGEKIGDRSSLFFSTFCDKVIASIDISKIEPLGKKQQYINSTGEYAKGGLTNDLNVFRNKVRTSYLNTRNKGMDLISMLVEKIDNDPLVKESTFLTDGIDTTLINYDNHFYIFTDGYLEYYDKDVNGEFYFGQQDIEKVRKYCKEKKTSVDNALELDRSLCLPPYISDKNKLINLHILETHERDKDEKSLKYKHVVGQRDNEILEAVWRKWAKDSGFKNSGATDFWEKY